MGNTYNLYSEIKFSENKNIFYQKKYSFYDLKRLIENQFKKLKDKQHGIVLLTTKNKLKFIVRFYALNKAGFKVLISNSSLSKEEALKLITLNPAKILGISDRTGTLEVGKDANLFVSNGDILNILTNNVELIFLKGKQVSIQNHQTELYQKYLSKYNLK